MDELRSALEGDDMDEEFFNDLHAAMLESLRYSNEKQDEKQDEKKDDTMNEEKDHHDEVD